MICTYFAGAVIIIGLFSQISGDYLLFPCENKQFLSNKYVCDGKDDCGDNSDEKLCSQTCYTNPPTNYDEKKEICINISENCKNNYSSINSSSSTDQPVIWLKVQYSCAENYQINANGSSCDSTAPNGTVAVYPTQGGIVVFNISTNQTNSIVNNTDGTVDALTAAQNFIYWSSKSNNFSNIFKKSINVIGDTNQPLVHRDHNINSTITSIAIDWRNDNIYFTWDKFLSVCSGNGTRCTCLKNSDGKISSVAVAPTIGLMFWTRNNASKSYTAEILQSAMDGTDERNLFDEKSVNFKSLVVDEYVKKLYWLNTERQRIYSIRFDDGSKKVEELNFENVFSFAAFENQLYWTLKGNATVIKRSSNGLTSVLIENKNKTNELVYVYNPLLQYTQLPKPCSSASCKGLCLPRQFPLNTTCLLCENVQPTVNSKTQWCTNDDKSNEKLPATSEAPTSTSQRESTKLTSNGGSTTSTSNGGSTTSTSNGGSTTSTSNGGSTISTSNGGSTTSTSNGGSTTSTSNGGSTTSTSNGGSTTSTSNGGSTISTSNGGSTTSTSNRETTTQQSPKTEENKSKTEHSGMGTWTIIIIILIVLVLLSAATYFGFKYWSQDEGNRNFSVLFKRNTTRNN